MASSVSSERAFSVAGITISKRRNRLKADIVEALQCLKCLIHHDLLFREVDSTTEIEKELDDLGNPPDGKKNSVDTVNEAETFSWDQLVEDNDEVGDPDE